MDLGSEHDMSDLPSGKFKVGGVPFQRPETGKDCIILRGDATTQPIAIGKRARGFVFLQAVGASEAQLKTLVKRFRSSKNVSQYGMPIAYYQVRYVDGNTISVPMEIGWNVHLWDCTSVARVMPGARSFWAGFTQAGKKKDPNAPDISAWTMEWKNPRPTIAIKDVTIVAADTEATAVCLGITAVE